MNKRGAVEMTLFFTTFAIIIVLAFFAIQLGSSAADAKEEAVNRLVTDQLALSYLKHPISVESDGHAFTYLAELLAWNPQSDEVEEVTERFMETSVDDCWTVQFESEVIATGGESCSGETRIVSALTPTYSGEPAQVKIITGRSVSTGGIII